MQSTGEIKKLMTNENPKKSLITCVIEYLASQKEARHYKAITDYLLKNNLWSTNGATPEATVNAALSTYIKKTPADKCFLDKAGNGLYAINNAYSTDLQAVVPDTVDSTKTEPVIPVENNQPTSAKKKTKKPVTNDSLSAEDSILSPVDETIAIIDISGQKDDALISSDSKVVAKSPLVQTELFPAESVPPSEPVGILNENPASGTVKAAVIGKSMVVDGIYNFTKAKTPPRDNLTIETCPKCGKRAEKAVRKVSLTSDDGRSDLYSRTYYAHEIKVRDGKVKLKEFCALTDSFGWSSLPIVAKEPVTSDASVSVQSEV